MSIMTKLIAPDNYKNGNKTLFFQSKYWNGHPNVFKFDPKATKLKVIQMS